MAGVIELAPASLGEWREWICLGYLGSFEEYKQLKKRHAGTVIHLSGSIQVDNCSIDSCLKADDIFCDYPVGHDKTCDRGLCSAHAHKVGKDLHYCEAHYRAWMRYASVVKLPTKDDE